MENIIVEMVTKIIEYAPAVGILLWLTYRAEQRAQQCVDKLYELLLRFRDK